MTKLRLNKAMFFVLVTAMLSMQWSTAHIHLAEHHDHDGSQHQHNIKAHAHQSLIHDDDFSDKASQQEIKIVELSNDCNIHSWNNIDDQAIASSSVKLELNFTSHLNNIKSVGFNKSKRRYIDYSTINLRAPPKLS